MMGVCLSILFVHLSLSPNETLQVIFWYISATVILAILLNTHTSSCSFYSYIIYIINYKYYSIGNYTLYTCSINTVKRRTLLCIHCNANKQYSHNINICFKAWFKLELPQVIHIIRPFVFTQNLKDINKALIKI